MIELSTIELCDIMCALLEYWLQNPDNKTSKKVLDFLKECESNDRRIITIGIKKPLK